MSDGSKAEFAETVLRLVRQIPRGRVATYGDIATYAGSPRAARAVGSVLRGTSYTGEVVPWQRVINARGGISGRSDLERAVLQRKLLEAEGVEFSEDGRTDLERYRWRPERAPEWAGKPTVIDDPFTPPRDWEDPER